MNNLMRVVFASLFVLLALGTVGCGTSTVRLMVVRPAVINAQPHGGTVMVGAILPAHVELGPAARHLRLELQRRIAESFGGVVRLVVEGGGLMIDGRLEEQRMRSEISRRETTCDVEVKTRDGDSTITKRESRPCVMKRTEWRSRVTVVARVVNSNGAVLYQRRLMDRESGQTRERASMAPAPNVEAVLANARNRLAARMAQIVAPYRVQVSATMHHCPGAAEAVCESAVAAFARSQYDPALAAYDRALELMRKDPNVKAAQLAEVHWNKAMVFKYSRRFDHAVAALDRALKLDPGESDYRRERDAVEAERQAHHKLIDQGLGGK